MHADRLGDPSAPPVVFIHGITGSRRYFRSRVSPLAARYRLIIPDLPGFGLSPKPHVAYTPSFFRDAVRRFLETEGIAGRPFVLVGHSLGAIVSAEYAAAWPGDVKRMVLVNLPRYTSPEEAHLLFWAGSPNYRKLLGEHSIAANMAQLRRTGVDLFLRYAFSFPFAVYADCRKFTLRSLTSTLLDSLIYYSVDGTLSRIRNTPTLLIHGRRDTVAPLKNIRDLVETYPFMRLVTIDGSGHHVLLTHSRRCLRLIDAFLREDASPASERRGTAGRWRARIRPRRKHGQV